MKVNELFFQLTAIEEPLDTSLSADRYFPQVGPDDTVHGPFIFLRQTSKMQLDIGGDFDKRLSTCWNRAKTIVKEKSSEHTKPPARPASVRTITFFIASDHAI
jgi:hypothetical protein